jgi:hypothetical protein
MNNAPQAYQEWLRVVSKKMSHLSKPQAVVLSMWSFAIAMTHCCGLSTVSVFLGQLLEQPENNIREQLRQWYREGGEQYGRKRSQLEVSKSFVPLLRWILSWWKEDEQSLVLAADASTLGQRFTLLVISVVYRGCGIPVAWKIVEATEKGSWKPHWLKLLHNLEDGVPRHWLVIVTTDRGLYAKWFYEAIQQIGWHPLMRINHQGYYQLDRHQSFLPLSGLITQERAERLWLAIAVATLWLVSVGGKAETDLPVSSLPSLSELDTERDREYSTKNSIEPSLKISSPIRVLSCFRRGFLTILASVIRGMPLPIGSFIPDFSPATG